MSLRFIAATGVVAFVVGLGPHIDGARAWPPHTTPLAALAIGMAGGVLIAGVPLAMWARMWRRRARSLDARVAVAEGILEQHERLFVGFPPGR